MRPTLPHRDEAISFGDQGRAASAASLVQKGRFAYLVLTVCRRGHGDVPPTKVCPSAVHLMGGKRLTSGKLRAKPTQLAAEKQTCKKDTGHVRAQN